MSFSPCLSKYAACIVVALMCGAVPASALTTTLKATTDSTIVDISVESWLEHVPPTGLIPVTVSVHNHTTSPGQWRVMARDQDYMNGTMRSSFTVAAPPGGMTRTSLLIPVMPTYNSSSRSYKNVQLTVEGPGVAFPGLVGSLTAHHAPSSSGSVPPPRSTFVALSEGFDTSFGTRWKADIRRDWHGDVVQMKDAPVDWRGYSGLVQIWMLERDWTAMSRPQREALLGWVAQGGAAFINVSSPSPSLPWLDTASPWNGAERRYGLGTIRALTDGQVKSEAATLIHHSSEIALERAVNTRMSGADALGTLLPALKMNGTLIFAFILIFGVAVGPVNLFWLAAGPRRPRLFWTTPLISCAGTAVLIAVMVLQDGFGGTGARISLAIVLPEQKQMTVVQEQFTKTGILTSSAFELPAGEQAWISPVPETSEVKSRFGSMTSHVDKREYSVNGSQSGGGWFKSRAIQSQLVSSQRLNRGSIELGGGDQPFVISSLSGPLKNFYLQDDKGRVWKADSVPVGQRTALKASSSEDLYKWKRNQATWSKNMGSPMRTRLARYVPLQNNGFFAEAGEPAKIALSTLSSIQWAQDRAFVAGTCVPAVAR